MTENKFCHIEKGMTFIILTFASNFYCTIRNKTTHQYIGDYKKNSSNYKQEAGTVLN